MTQPAIAIENLRVVAGRRAILTVQTLEIGCGQVVAVLGPNGAGKTTLLETCLGFRRLASGSVRVLGQPVERCSSFALTRLRQRIGYVPQALPAAENVTLTVREVVAIGRTGRVGLLRPLSRTDWRSVDHWLARLGLESMAHQLYSRLSGGEQRKTLLARALVQEPEILMLDEPTAHLDLGWREQIVSTLQQLADAWAGARTSQSPAPRTLVLVCHELEVLPPCCRRVVLLEAGGMVADGPPEEVLTNQRAAEWYGPGLRVVRAGRRFAVLPADSCVAGAEGMTGAS